MLCTAAAAKTIYVDDNATGANDGTSWSDAYVYLQEALADARLAEKPVEIRVAQGIYKPNEGLVAIPEFDWRTATFQLISGVTLKGGYAGVSEPAPDTRGVEVYETILSGDLSGDDAELADPFYLFDERTRSENSYHVVTGGGTNATAVLDGFTISDGNANGPRLGWYPNYDYTLRNGAGVYNISGDPTVRNCTFIRNSARNDGGAMYNEQSNLSLIDCTFSGNSAHTGGGIRNVLNSNSKVTNCTFTRNSARSSGAGMANYQSSPLIVDCTFSENNAFHHSQAVGGGGGGMTNRESNPILTNCTFSGNSAQWGGGMANGSSSNPTLTNCTFSGNVANGGAGISNYVASGPLLINCTFSGNSASSWGGGMDSRDDSGPNLINCTFTGNSARNGNALAYNFLMPQDKPSNVELINCILWDGGDEIWNNDGSTITMTYSDIQGGQASVFDPCETLIWGKGNTDADPCFANSGYWADANDLNGVVETNEPNAVWIDGDYHLKSQTGRWNPVSGTWIRDDVTSPCIDAGDPNSDWASEVWPHGGRINMGAYGGTREASMSIQPQEMSPPSVAYIHERDTEAAESYQSLLVSYGCPTTLIGLDDVATAPLDFYDLVIVGNDTGSLSHWGDAESVVAIENSGKPVLGLGEGGYAFFGKLGLEIGWPNGMHGSLDSIEVTDPNNSLFNVPYAIDVPDDRVLQLYSETENVDLYLWPMPETVTALAKQVKSHGYYPLALEHDRSVLWGFTASPENMTHVGKTLFVNVVIRAANVAW